jgi:hypothetical protein
MLLLDRKEWGAGLGAPLFFMVKKHREANLPMYITTRAIPFRLTQ